MKQEVRQHGLSDTTSINALRTTLSAVLREFLLLLGLTFSECGYCSEPQQEFKITEVARSPTAHVTQLNANPVGEAAVYFRFSILNDTTVPLQIADLRVSCGCTTAALSTDVAAPGVHIDVSAKIQFDSTDQEKEELLSVSLLDGTALQFRLHATRSRYMVRHQITYCHQTNGSKLVRLSIYAPELKSNMVTTVSAFLDGAPLLLVPSAELRRSAPPAFESWSYFSAPISAPPTARQRFTATVHFSLISQYRISQWLY